MDVKVEKNYSTELKFQKFFKMNNNKKGPSKALQGDQDKLPSHLQKGILAAPGMVDMEAPGMYNKSKSKVEQDYARNAIHDFKSGKKSEGNYEKKKELEVAAGEGFHMHSGHKVNKNSKRNRS